MNTRKIIYGLIILITCFFISSCTFVDEDDGTPKYDIYLLARSSGYEGTYEEWLESIAGEDGREIEITINNDIIVWRYIGETDYEPLISLNSLKGLDGIDGSQIELSTSATHIIWKYIDENIWHDLLPFTILEETSGKSAYELALEVGYTGSLEEWLKSLKGHDGKEIELSTNTTHIIWKYNDELIWHDLISLQEITGKDADVEKVDKLYEALSNLFILKENQFILSSTSSNKPTWNYCTSTFSGWGGSIGKPEEIDTMRFKVRARDKAITQIKVYLTEKDKMGIIINEDLLDVNIQPYTETDVIWSLEQKYINIDNIPLYFTFNCNALCDYYVNASTNIPTDEYQAISTYCCNGKTTAPALMTNVYTEYCLYTYVEFGSMKSIYIPNNELNDQLLDRVDVFLPDEYYLTINDNFQLFYRGVIMAVNPYNYAITVKTKKGNSYPRYYEWKPTIDDIGEYELILEVKDDNGILLGSDKTTLIVNAPVEENVTQNVLCIGDSLTSGGLWVGEAMRRFTEVDGNPIGLGYNYLNFVGTIKKTINSKTFGYEGRGGWTWAKYCSVDSPFYDPSINDINFINYCNKNNIEDIDIVYILLTWNGHSTSYMREYDLNKGHFYYAQKLIDRIHLDYPQAIIRCMGIQMPSQNGGMGANYSSSSMYSDTYGMLVTAINYNNYLEKLCKLDKYRNFVKYIDIAGQFDTDYNMPFTNKPVNNRNPLTEVMGTNGVHPSVYGYYQIGDAVYRALCYDSILIN